LISIDSVWWTGIRRTRIESNPIEWTQPYSTHLISTHIQCNRTPSNQETCMHLQPITYSHMTMIFIIWNKWLLQDLSFPFYIRLQWWWWSWCFWWCSWWCLWWWVMDEWIESALNLKFVRNRSGMFSESANCSGRNFEFAWFPDVWPYLLQVKSN
jgi:hypothetical protein